MALIPSESASFPDLLGRGLGASKKSKWRIPDEIAPPPAQPRGLTSEPVSEPNVSREPPPSTEMAQPAPPPPVEPAAELPSVGLLVAPQPPVPTPAALSEEKTVTAPTHAPIPIVRIARSMADRAVESNPDVSVSVQTDPIQQEQPIGDSQPVIPAGRTSLFRPRVRPRPPLQPRFEPPQDAVEPVDSHAPAPAPAPEPQPGTRVPIAPQYAALQFTAAAPNDDAEEFGFPEADKGPNAVRRRARLLRLVLWELFALTVAGLAILVGLNHRSPDDPVALAAKIVTIVFAIAVAAIPVVLYGLPERLPRSDR